MEVGLCRKEGRGGKRVGVACVRVGEVEGRGCVRLCSGVEVLLWKLGFCGRV